jgi:hypothetical protein
MASDQPYPYPDDPVLRAAATCDIPQSSHQGDVWFNQIRMSTQDTAWDILNVFLQTTAWDTLNENNQDIAWDILNAWAFSTAWDILNDPAQDTSWSIFPHELYFLKQFFVKQIALNFGIKAGDIVPFPGLNLSNDYHVLTPIKYNFTIKNPTVFDIYLKEVLQGVQTTESRGN